MAQKRPESTFEFPPELGQRLRELRLKAGLTQERLASLMGRQARTMQSRIARLERGKIEFPTIAFIADYLRACRAGFRDVLDILDAYTSRPHPEEEKGSRAVDSVLSQLPRPVGDKMLKYDAKLRIRRRVAGREPEPAGSRVRKVQKLAASWLQRQELEDRLHSVLNRLQVSSASQERQQLAVYGRKVWGILNRTRLKNQEKRAGLLARAADKLEQENLAPVELARDVARQVAELFTRMEQSGELDKYPTTALAEKLAAQSPRRRVRTDADQSRQARLATLGQEQSEIYQDMEAARREARMLVEEQGVGRNLLRWYVNASCEFMQVARRTEPGSKQRDKAVDAILAKDQYQSCDRGLLKHLAHRVLRLQAERKPRS